MAPTNVSDHRTLSPSSLDSAVAMTISSGSAIRSSGTPEQSASCIVAKAASGSHTLTIDGFSRIKGTNDRRNRMSGTFTVGGHTWCSVFVLPRFGPLAGWIYMVPRLCCTHCCAGEEVSAASSFSLLDHNGQPSNTRSVGRVCTFTKMTSTGVEFVNLNFLESRAATYMPGDCLRVRCDLTVYMEPHCEDRDVPSRVVAVPPPDIGDHLGRLLSSGVGADLMFEVAGETFTVHRHILNVRSQVLLEDMISGATTCEQIIGGMEARVFKALLHYIYTDSLPEIDEGETTTDMARQLIAAANRYSLDRLKLICEYMLCRRVNTSTVAAMLALAEGNKCHGLKKACFQFLMSSGNLKAAMAAGGFEHLKSSCPSVLKELLAIMVDRR